MKTDLEKKVEWYESVIPSWSFMFFICLIGVYI
jgi:hypothetical protein